ncbi:sigma-54-dependent Fis family transcriptional regulator [Ideonella oryzae]|uniref:Sigma-54-dependent Fis family transcriptional regulator n=1 Tax=Ideonella oryzae TaxID=2937441 RepID=A0ABT1BS54_9BURK|nr:sigma-54-dependent Fis family transcriptional regulator [Ideonella oryzae]MCO5979020.1 sigma-54-dependent Fis family transcriptional regulator [Ideonella oryzae]
MRNALSSHIDNVISVGLQPSRSEGKGNLFYDSWTRCMRQHGLDPARPTPARILPSGQLREHQQRMESFLRVARAGMEEMYRRVADLGYMLLLTDADGIAVDYIGNPASEQQLKAAGLYLGADWNEAHAGTCGVGTCLIEQVPITCHQTEHFDATHIALTCTSSPLFAPDGQLLGVLDVSALHSPEARESQHLVFHLTSMYAQMIEDANFLRAFARHGVLRLGKSCGLVEVSGEVMFAFDEEGCIVGANTGARRRFGGSNGSCTSGIELVGRALDEVVGLGVDSLWAMARGGTAKEMSGLWTQLQEHYYPAVIAPRLRPQAAVRPQPSIDLGARSEGSAPAATALDAIGGGDAQIRDLIDRSKRLVDHGVSLLVLGETGSGKEVLARALHAHSRRRDKPFVAVNCASIPDSLIESELFGYTAGSFTGGRAKGAKGLILQADGGTLFLDEIGDMPLHLQTRLLRVLSEQEVLPIGAERPVPVQLNVMAATHRDLCDRVLDGSFREDLYYRLSGAVLQLPPLRVRADLGYLIERLCAEEAERLGRDVTLSGPALQALMRHDWPGNVRELRNAMRYAVAMSRDGLIAVDDLPVQVLRGTQAGPARLALERPAVPAGDAGHELGSTRLLSALKQHKWNVTAAAQALGICRATVYRQMKRHDITPPHLL